MLIKLEPCEGYFTLSHDMYEPGSYNDPDNRKTWDWDGPDDFGKKTCRINGGPFISPKEIGIVIKLLITMARQYPGEVDAYGYVDLSEEALNDALL